MSATSPSLAPFTLALHGGSFRHDPTTSATTVPIYQSTSFDFPDTATATKIIRFEQIAYTYSRVGNPTVDAFEQRLAALEGGAAGFAFVLGRIVVSSRCAPNTGNTSVSRLVPAKNILCNLVFILFALETHSWHGEPLAQSPCDGDMFSFSQR